MWSGEIRFTLLSVPPRQFFLRGLLLGAALCLAERVGVAQTPASDTASLARQLSTSSGAARIPLLLQLAQQVQDDPAQVLRLTDEALRGLADHPSLPLEVSARTAQAHALQSLARYPAALIEAQRAESLARVSRSDTLIALAAFHLGQVEWRLARYPAAMTHTEQARTLQEPRGNSLALTHTLLLLSAIQRSQGNLERALELNLAALRMAEAIGNEVAVAKTHNNIGLVYWDLGQHQAALGALQRALAIHERLGPRGNLANTLNNVGLVLEELKRSDEAIPYLERALGIDRERGDLKGQATTYSNLGWASKDLGDTVRALSYFQQALSLREQIGDKDGTVRSRGAIAEVLLDRGKTREAIRLYESAIALADSINDRLDLIDQLQTLARARASLGDTAGAFRAFTRFHELQAAQNDSASRARMAELDTKYQTLDQERDLARAHALAESRRRTLGWLATGSLLLAASLVGLGLLYVGRGRAQRDLSESEARYRALFQTSALPTFLVEVGARRLVDRNDAARRLSQPAAPTPALETLEPEWVRRALDRALAADGDHAAFDDRWTDASGRLRFTEVRSSAVTLHGRSCRLVTLHDATDLRTREEARQREDRMQSIGVLAGGIAHDFNNALAGILGNLALAREGDAAERSQLLDQAEQAALQARRLTSQLLAFSRGGEPVRRPTRLGALLGNAARLAAAGSHMRVELDIPEGLWPAHLDEGQFSQVVSNLVINASQATGEGGRLLIRAANHEGDPASGTPSPQHRAVRITFEDNGSGIPEAIRDRVFDPYFTTKGTGTGLGLTTAFAICRNHGGSLQLVSRQGQGTTFTVFLPATSEAAVAAEPAESGVPPAGGRVLLLDDEPLVRTMLRRMLERWGYEVEAVADGREAVASYVGRLREGAPFDLLIMDLTIPGGMGGRQALAEILREDPSARAIVASGYSDDPVMANYQSAGFRAVLAKPFRNHELAEAIRTAMRGATPASPPAPPAHRPAVRPSAASS